MKFEIKEEFLLDGKPFRIVSGAVHYFRIVPEDWENTLYNLKSMGCNTVETYVPWNLHEPEEGVYDFTGGKDIGAFLRLAQEMGLFAIVRPSPYICAEWEFGGLPAWLLRYSDMKVRTNTPLFLEKVRNYYEHLFPVLVPLQVTHGGPVLMMQVENEYGSYGNDKEYLRRIKALMMEFGTDVPLFTSDGSWMQALEAGSLIEDGILATANFGSHCNENLDVLEEFFRKHNRKWPLMCMEFWDGWFNRWNEAIVKRDAKDLAMETSELLKRASVNFYMFRGGTNFGFMNGCSAREQMDLPQVTSYDYDAIMTEWGEATEKYYQLKEVIGQQLLDHRDPYSAASYSVASSINSPPRHKKLHAYPPAVLTRQVSLFETVSSLANPIHSDSPLTMEEAGSGYGYLLYQKQIAGYEKTEKMKVVDASDQIQVYINQKLAVTQDQETAGNEFEVFLEQKNRIDILLENMGRVNYGYKLPGPSQRKGIRSGVRIDIHFESGWTQYALSLEDISKVNFDAPWIEGTPAFYEYVFEADVCEDTFLDCSQLGKGCAFINGFSLGRYWSKGPIQYLYIPGSRIQKGTNTIVVFETDGALVKELVLRDVPTYS